MACPPPPVLLASFSETTHYSQLVINSRINDFLKANTIAGAGFGVFDSKGNFLQQPKMWAFSHSTTYQASLPRPSSKPPTTTKDRKDIDVAPWFYAIQYYGCTYDIADNGKGSKSFDDLNAVKLYFKLAEMAASERFPTGADSPTPPHSARPRRTICHCAEGYRQGQRHLRHQASTLEGAAGGWFLRHRTPTRCGATGRYMGPALLAQDQRGCRLCTRQHRRLGSHHPAGSPSRGDTSGILRPS